MLHDNKQKYELFIIDAVENPGVNRPIIKKDLNSLEIKKRYSAYITKTNEAKKERLIVDVNWFDNREDADKWFTLWLKK